MRYQINYELCAGMQRMGCAGTQLETLMGMLGIRGWQWRHFQCLMESQLGTAEEEVVRESMQEGLCQEVKASTEANSLNQFQYRNTVLPLLILSYGTSFTG